MSIARALKCLVVAINSSSSVKQLAIVVLCFAILGLGASSVSAHPNDSWSRAKSHTARRVYTEHHLTLYCGCSYTPTTANSSSGVVDLDDCGLDPDSMPDRYLNRRTVLEWEHIVPAKLMPVSSFSCWSNPERWDGCSGRRDCCEDKMAYAQAALFDLHNLAPSIGQVNAIRRDDMYGELGDSEGELDEWGSCESRHMKPNDGTRHIFEPADCVKGDVARVWFYMHDRYGVNISDEDWEMFQAWAEADPVSPWESARDVLLGAPEAQGNNNPYVFGVEPDPSGSCPWDPDPVP